MHSRPHARRVPGVPGSAKRRFSRTVAVISISADVYPILAFLAGTYPGGTNPPWIVNGSYDLEDRSGQMRPALSLRGELGNGPLRSNLAAPSPPGC